MMELVQAFTDYWTQLRAPETQQDLLVAVGSGLAALTAASAVIRFASKLVWAVGRPVVITGLFVLWAVWASVGWAARLVIPQEGNS